jgi:hypothetical protein
MNNLSFLPLRHLFVQRRCSLYLWYMHGSATFEFLIFNVLISLIIVIAVWNVYVVVSMKGTYIDLMRFGV